MRYNRYMTETFNPTIENIEDIDPLESIVSMPVSPDEAFEQEISVVTHAEKKEGKKLSGAKLALIGLLATITGGCTGMTPINLNQKGTGLDYLKREFMPSNEAPNPVFASYGEALAAEGRMHEQKKLQEEKDKIEKAMQIEKRDKDVENKMKNNSSWKIK
jgi:hypothetical protein